MKDGFSPDGYIIDQDCFGEYPYRGITSDINGCGWIAAYNFLYAQGKTGDHRAVNREMNAMFPRQVPGPTPVRILRRYLRRHTAYCFTAGRKRSLAAARKSDSGILRYWEGKVPHFISFIRVGEDAFRFFNVADGQEDICLSMEEFFRSHCLRGWIRVITDK